VDHEHERELICKSLEEAKRAVNLTFNFATTDSLRSVVTLGCQILHYSGHATSNGLSLEDGCSGMHHVKVSQIKSLFAAGAISGGKLNMPRLCFVNACSSRLAGEAFVAAGVSHVVCVESQTELMDKAAAVFTRSFYLALLHGLTVQASFDIGREAVKASPNIDPAEADKFLLLPENDVHETAIFSDVSYMDWKSPAPLSVDRIPSPPEGFLGRNVEMYHVISKVLRHRLVSICGPTGVGKTAIALAVANYVSERQYFREGVFYKSLQCVSTLQELILELSRELQLGDATADGIFMALQRRQSLLVLDNPDFEREEIRAFFRRLLEHTRNVKLLFTCLRPISAHGPLFGVAEKIVVTGPLTPASSARLLLRRSPRPIEPQEIGALSYQSMLELISNPPYLERLPLVPGRIVSSALELNDVDLRTFLMGRSVNTTFVGKERPLVDRKNEQKRL